METRGHSARPFEGLGIGGGLDGLGSLGLGALVSA